LYCIVLNTEEVRSVIHSPTASVLFLLDDILTGEIFISLESLSSFFITRN